MEVVNSQNLIADADGKTITKNKHNSLPGAMKIVVMISIGYFAMDTLLDVIAIPG